MNIAVDIRCLQSKERTGVGEYAFELLSALFKIDHENQYFLFSNSFSNSQPSEFTVRSFSGGSVHHAHFRIPNKLLTFSEIFGGPRLDKLIENRFKIKLDLWFSPNLNFTNLSADIPHVITIHDLTFEFFPEFQTLQQRLWHWLLCAKKQCDKAAHIFTPSQNTKMDLIHAYKIPAEKIQLLYPGLSSVFNQNAGQQIENRKSKISARGGSASGGENPYILFLGTVEPRKNIEALIDAFILASPQLQNKYNLLIAGAEGWRNRNLKSKIKNLKSSIRLIGYVNDKDKPALYQGASLFIYPSFYEGFGFPALEAMASGVPVITPPRSSLPEVCGNAVYYANPYRPGEIAEGMMRILNSKSLSADLTKKGLEKSQDFRWEKTANEWLGMIKMMK